MRRKIILHIVIVVTFLIAGGINLYTRIKESPQKAGEVDLKLVMPEGDSFEKKEQPFLYYEVYKKGDLAGYAFNTKDVVPEERGYGGPIETLVGLSRDGRVIDLAIFRHNETLRYASDITKRQFLDQFKGKGPGDSFIVGKDIDGITHATISTNAVARALETGVYKMKGIIQVEGARETRPLRPLKLGLDFYITVLIITFLVAVYYLRITLLRYAGLLVSIVYFGFIKANFISMAHLGTILVWEMPGLTTNISWYVFIISGMVLTFLLGAFYCSYMCPFGGLQIFINKIFRMNIEMSPRLSGILRKTRFILLWILSIIVLLLNNKNVVDYEPFSTVFLRKGSLVAWGIVIIIIALSLFHYRPFCNYFCAAGAFLDLVTRWGKKVLRKDAEAR